jgi:15-cis-phytoene synthase / lycopene beta-cyclase
MAVSSTIPWDSYLIRTGVWSYPADAVLGPTLFLIPYEELFFFFIQTYITAQLYLILSKPVLHPLHLSKLMLGTSIERLGALLLLTLSLLGGYLVYNGEKGTYLGLILVWACPFLLFTW